MTDRSPAYLTLDSESSITLHGSWTLPQLTQLKAEITGVHVSSGESSVDASGIEALDTAGV
jgi:hypothetical protein